MPLKKYVRPPEKPFSTVSVKSGHVQCKTFLSDLPTAAWWAARSYRRFEDAAKTRNRCAHVNQGEPTLQEVKQSIELAGLLQRFV